MDERRWRYSSSPRVVVACVLFVLAYSRGNCQTTAYQFYAHEIRTYPFPVSIVGLRRNNLRFLFGHPSEGSQGLLADITAGEREFCDGVPVREVLTESAIQVYWNPAIVFEWDPDWGDDPGYRIDVDGRTSVTDTGQCGSMYTGEYGGEGEGCTYQLTMWQAGASGLPSAR